ncbi:MAG TPA: ComEC/Rec2 family competence protein [Rhizomicrobium sp.]|nr:ComEC/Rec2 family competence protein [Rhizomicrobium sp.]
MANGGVGEASVLRRNAESGTSFSLLRRFAASIRKQAEADRIRWVLWLPVALGAGVGVYFGLPVEPDWEWGLTAGALALTWTACAAIVPHTGLRIVLALLAAGSLGFGTAKLRTELVRAPVLQHKVGPVSFDGRVVTAEPRGNGSRMVLQPVRIGRLGAAMPLYVRVSVRAHSAVPAPGSWLHVTAVLMPPPGPAMPGDYDFGRWAYYQRIGAVGYLYGRPKPIAVLRASSLREEALDGLERLRGQMTARVRSVIPGHEGVISAALITGERADIDPDDQTAFRDSGLMHVLSISGLHLALAGGVFFWTIRAVFALFPAIVLRFPVKKWAAAGALAGSTFYLLISGCEAPAVRSWIMLAIMFAAVLVDRPALSMRSVAVAATLILLGAPESLNDPGCQMSFSAVIGLIALAEWEQARRAAHPEEGANTLWRRARRYLVGIAVTSIVAGLATAPIAIFHFDRASPFGIIANLAALPVVSAIIMPAAVVVMVTMPFGLDYWPLVVMGKGVGAMLAIAHWVADLPGAGSVVPAWPQWCMVAVMGGGLWIALWRKPWRWAGLAPIAVGIGFALAATPPDLLIARDGRTVGVRLESGRLALIRRITDDFAAADWLRRSGDARQPGDAIGGPGVKCDAYGCLARAHGGVLVAIDERADALAEDCANAPVVVSMVPARRLCPGPKLVIDRYDAARAGGYAVWLGKSIRVQTVEELRGRRPWSMRPPHPENSSLRSEFSDLPTRGLCLNKALSTRPAQKTKPLHKNRGGPCLSAK